MKKLLALIAGIFLSTAATPVLATPGGLGCGTPTAPLCKVELKVGTLPAIDLSSQVTLNTQTGLWGLDVRLADSLFDGLASGVFVNAQINPDPFIGFGGGLFNLTDDNLFWGLHIDTPIDLDGLVDAKSTISYTLNDSGGTTNQNGSVTLTASDSTAPSRVGVFSDFIDFQDPQNKGVDIGTTVTATTAAATSPCSNLSSVGGSAACPFPDETNTFLLNGHASKMNADIGLFISAFDGFSLTGSVEQNVSAVPEPASLLLIGTGLLGLAGWRRYSSRG